MGEMATISVGAAIGEGFSLIRRQPGAVALWALLAFGFLALRAALYAPFYGALFAQMAHGARSANGSPDIQALLPQLQQMQAFGLLFSLASLLLNSVLICGVYRAVLHPEKSAFGYLRVGAAELFLFVFAIGVLIVFFVALLVAMIPVGIVVAFAAQGSPGGAVAVGVIAGVLILIAAIYLFLRLALVGPMMVDDGQFHLGDAWALTRGKAGSLFLIALTLVVMLIVAELVIVAVGAGVLGAATGGFTEIPALVKQGLAAVVSRLAPGLAVVALGWLLLVGCAIPVFYAPWARVYRDLKHTDLAAAFS